MKKRLVFVLVIAMLASLMAVNMMTSFAAAQTIFTTQTPQGYSNDMQYALGTKFKTTVNGTITGVRIYTNSTEAGAHMVRIWRISDSTVVSGPHTWDITSGTTGWKTYTLPTPLSITANTDYIVSVTNSSDKWYAYRSGGFDSPINNGDLVTYVGSGVYSTSINSMPTTVWNNSSYFRDVIFEPISENLLTNPGFESGTTGWSAQGGTIAQEPSIVHSGTRSCIQTGRTATWHGPLQNILSVLQANGQGNYTVSGWLRLGSGSDTAKITINTNDDTGSHWFVGTHVSVNSSGWAQYSTTVNITWSGALSSASFYAETTSSTANLYLDDCNLTKSGGETPPDSLRGWQINSSNCGLTGAGVDKNNLPLYSGAIPAGTTISLRKIVNPEVSAGNIILDRCWIVSTASGAWFIGSPNGSVTIKDSLIEGSGEPGKYYACPKQDPGNQPVTLLRTEITHQGGGFWFDGPGTVQNCYIHNLPGYGDPAGSGNHVDGGTRRSGTAQLNIIDNHIDVRDSSPNASAAFFIQPIYGYIDNILLQGNLFGGGGWVVYVENHSGNTYGTHINMDNNRWYPNPVYGYTAVQSGPGFGQWANNYVNDPTKTDNKGAVINEP